MIRNRTRGFTLIELMITVAIIAILSAVAFPAYTSYIQKGRRAEAKTALTDLLQQQERFLTQRNCYMAFTTSSSTGIATAVANTACGITASTTVPFKNFSGDSLASTSYLISAGTCDSTTSISDCVLLSAVPKKTDATVGTLTITSTGVKSCTGTAAAEVPNGCWK